MPVTLPKQKKAIPKVKYSGKSSDGKDDKYNDTNKVAEKKDVEKMNNSPWGILEALKSDNHMSSLKKSASIPVKISESKLTNF